MKGRTYVVVTALSWALILLWSVYWAREDGRMAATTAAFRAEMVDRGATIFAQSCVTCHGPAGEGAVGPSLNRAALRGDPENDRDVYDFIYRTVSQGRPGSVVTRWQELASGEIASFSQMPAWSRDHGGPLDEQALRAVTAFVMAGDWGAMSRRIPAAKLDGPLPVATGLSPEENDRAQAIIRQKGCLACHTMGSTGGTIGPDLSHVGSWGISQSFLQQWIADPPAMTNRGPVWFSNSAGIDPSGQPSGIRIEYGPTQMPRLGLTQGELEALSRYLMGLK